MNHTFKIYTDGSWKAKTNTGGFSFFKENKETPGETAAYYKVNIPNVTNNQMELQAVIEALKSTPIKSHVMIYTDSAYVCNGYNQYLDKWKDNNWRTSKNEPVKNLEQWFEIDKLCKERFVNMMKVKAHTGKQDVHSIGNEIADHFASNY